MRPARSRPASGATSPARTDSTDVLPAPLTPISPTRSPGPSLQVTRSTRSRPPRVIVASSRSSTSLPSLAAANCCSSTRSRGGGSSSISSQAASSRNFGLEVRAGAPRAARRAPCGRGSAGASRSPRLAHPLGLRQHECRIAAVVAVDRARRAPPTSWCTRRPGTSGRASRRPGRTASATPAGEMTRQPVDRLDVEVVGRLVEQQHVEVARATPAPARPGVARHRTGRRPSGPGRARPTGARRSRRASGSAAHSCSARSPMTTAPIVADSSRVVVLADERPAQPAVVRHPPGIRRLEPREDRAAGRLAVTVASDDADPIAVLDPEADVGQQRPDSVGLRDRVRR